MSRMGNDIKFVKYTQQILVKNLGLLMTRIKHCGTIVFAMILVVSFSAYANDEVRCPPIEASGLTGVWEAAYAEDSVILLYRLEFYADGSALLTQSSSHGIFISVLEKKSAAAGKVELVLRSQMRNIKYQYQDKTYQTTGAELIEGVGELCTSPSLWGHMRVKLTMEPGLPPPKVWPLQFYRLDQKSLGEEFSGFSLNAQDATKKFRDKR